MEQPDEWSHCHAWHAVTSVEVIEGFNTVTQ